MTIKKKLKTITLKITLPPDEARSGASRSPPCAAAPQGIQCRMRISESISCEILSHRLASLGFPLPSAAVHGLAVYLGQLMKWNRAMNLVGTRTWEETLDTLVVDSLHLADFLATCALPPAPVTWDLGAGAGLPGIPLRLLWHEGTYILVEAREKRALFMRTALAGINLAGTDVYHGRAEDFFSRAGKADLILSRAFMPWRDMLAFISEPLSPAGRVVFLTRTPAPEDLPEPWILQNSGTYAVNGKKRFFWCLTRNA